MVQKLQVMSNTIYSKWFNQFEYPNNNGKMIFNKQLGKEIPKDWEVKYLTDIVKWESASQPPKEVFKYKYQDGYIRFIQNRDYENDNHITFIPLLKTTKLCNKTDIMMDKYGDAGSVRYGLEGAYNVALAKISPIIPNTQEYIRKYLEQNSTYNYLHNACIASTRASLNESLLQNLLIVLPNQEVLKSFEKQQKNILYQILKIKKNNQELNKLKGRLLPIFINGQLNI